MSVIKVTKENFEEIKNSEKPVLLDFFADWCMPCQMIAPFIHEIADEHGEFAVGQINVDDEPELAAAFSVVSIPMIVVMKNGEVVNKAVGAQPKEKILAMLER